MTSFPTDPILDLESDRARKARSSRRSTILIVAGLSVCAIAVAVLLGWTGTYMNGQFLAPIQSWFETVADKPWAILIVIATFVAFGLTGFPQFALVGATALIFGPLIGFFYSLVATLVSASFHFAMGKRFGQQAIEKINSDSIRRFAKKVAKHGIAATALVRLVPTGPFIMVNMVAGATNMAYWRFLTGTTIGACPKIFVISFIGGNLLDLLQYQDMQAALMIVAALAVWVIIMLVVKRRFSSQ